MMGFLIILPRSLNKNSHPLSYVKPGFYALFFLCIATLITTASPYRALAQLQDPAGPQDVLNAPTEKPSLLKKWVPLLFGEDSKPGPQDTLVAPFADDQAKKIQENAKSAPILGDQQAPLDHPHISHQEIQQWLVDKISRALNFDVDTMETSITSMRQDFTANALQEYVNMLGSEGIFSAVRNQEMTLSSIIFEAPVLTFWDNSCRQNISEFTQDGRYYWRFDSQVIYNLSGQDSSNGSNNSGKNVDIRVLIGRVDNTTNPSGLQIISWTYAKPC